MLRIPFQPRFHKLRSRSSQGALPSGILAPLKTTSPFPKCKVKDHVQLNNLIKLHCYSSLLLLLSAYSLPSSAVLKGKTSVIWVAEFYYRRDTPKRYSKFGDLGLQLDKARGDHYFGISLNWRK